MKFPARIMAAFLAAFLTTPLASPASSATPDARAVTVGAEVAVVAPGNVTLLWRFQLADHWHLYGPFLNDSGFPPSIELDLPPAWQAEPLRWPVPERHLQEGGILDHVYHDELVLPQTLKGPADTRLPAIEATIRWLACRTICVPGDTSLTVTIPDSVSAAEMARFASMAPPRPLATSIYEAARTDQSIVITVPGASALTLIPFEPAPRLVDLVADGTVAGDQLELRLRPDSRGRKPLMALLVIDHNDGDQIAGSIVVQ